MGYSTSEITTLGSVAGLIAMTLRPPAVIRSRRLSRRASIWAWPPAPNARFPMSRLQKLWKLAVAATGDPCLGLLAARQFQPAMMHGLGLA